MDDTLLIVLLLTIVCYSLLDTMNYSSVAKNSSFEIDLSKNPNKIFSEINDPEGTLEVVFKIEGYKKNNDHYRHCFEKQRHGNLD